MDVPNLFSPLCVASPEIIQVKVLTLRQTDKSSTQYLEVYVEICYLPTLFAHRGMIGNPTPPPPLFPPHFLLFTVLALEIPKFIAQISIKDSCQETVF